MNTHFKFRLFAFITIISLVLNAVGTPTSVAHAAPAGSALSFNGSSQYVTFGSSIGTTTGLGAQIFTIETWFKRTGTGITTSTGTGGLTTAIPLVTKGRGEGDNSNLDMNYFFGIDSTNVLAADFEECARAQTGCPATTSNAAQGGQNYPVKGSTVIQNNVWYHAAVTFDGRYWKLYLNGNLETMSLNGDTGANRLPRWDSIQHAGIGTAMTSSGATAGFFAGVVDETRIWNVVRTQAEIQADMYNELTSGTGLMGRWGLNEGSGTAAANSISGRPNGTLTASPIWVTGFPDNVPPAAPTELSATSGAGYIDLNWTANAETDLSGYNVYRSTTSPVSLTSPINGSLLSSPSYHDTGMTIGTNYYVVVAVDSSGNKSLASNEVNGTPLTDTTPPAAPAGLGATAGNASINLTWTANSEPDLAGYNLYRSTAVGGPYTKVNTPLIAGASYLDSSLTNGVSYYYVLRAVDSSTNESENSNEVYAIPAEAATGLQFNGSNQYVNFGTASGLGAQNFTVETWFKRTGTGGSISTGSNGVTLIPLVAKGAPQADGTNVDENYVLGIRASDNVLAGDFEIFAACNSRVAGDNNPIVGVTPIVNDTWYHAAFTYDGTALKLYLNGNLESTLPSTCIPRYDNSQPAALATTLTTAPLAQGFFAGAMDETRIWNVARTQAEILNTINQQVTSGTGLVARWGMGEGSGTTIASSVGTFPGTLTNGPTFVTGAPFNIAPPTAPAAPTLLSATSTAGLQIDLAWTDNSNNETGFKVERSPDGSSGWTQIGTTAANIAAYSNGGLDIATQYCYRVRATNGNGDSDYSNISCATTPGEPNNGLNFSGGNTYATFGNPPALGLTQFTIETWFKRTGTGTSVTTGSGGITNAIPLVTKGTSDVDNQNNRDFNYFLGINADTNVLIADFEEGASGASPSLNHPVNGTTPIVMNTWYHAVATYDGTTWKLYLNGNLEATLDVGQPPRSDNTSPVAMGSSIKNDGTTLTPQGYFVGTLDEVRIWNYARTLSSIQGTLNSAITSPQAGLVARWGLNETSGTVVPSNAGTSVNGSITGTGYSWVGGAPSIVNHDPVFASSSPTTGSTNITTPPTLTANFTDTDLDELTVEFYGRIKNTPPGPDFTIIAIPDPQYLAASYPSIYNAQMNWVVGNKNSNNIVHAISLGDNVDTSTNTTQWTNATTAWDILTTGGVPYALGVGNHDGAPSSTGNFNTSFAARKTSQATYGGRYGTSDYDNYYTLFEASGMKFIVIIIEYDDAMTSTSNPVLIWANGVLQTNSDRRAIVVTHNLLNGGSSTSFSSQAQAIYDALKGNPNLFMMLGGHLDVARHRTDTFNGNTIYSLRSDYQMLDSQQSGYLRIMRFSPVDNKIYVSTYSPTQDRLYPSEPAWNQFELAYEMSSVASFTLIGTDTVPAGTDANVTWNGLNVDTEYEWYAVASDASKSMTGSTSTFTTAPPAISCYPLTINHTGSGSTPTASPVNSTGCPTGEYIAGENISLSGATPVTGWQVGGWTGTNNNASTASTNTVTMPASAHTASVVYSQIEYTLTITSANGTVAKSPDQATYHYGDSVQLTATPNTGWSFSNWSGGATGSANPVSITINGNTSVTANYTQNQYTLTITSANGTVTKNPSKATYTYGEIVQLTSTPNTGWSFSNWSGGATGSVNPVSITINGNTSVTANYTQNQYTLTITSANGTVTKTPSKATYTYGEIVQLTAVPNAGWTFANWTGGATGTTNPVSITINGNTSVTANYTQNQYTLTITSAHGTVTKTPSKATYTYGETVELTAVPDTGYTFANWSGALTGSANPGTVTIQGNTTVTANYTLGTNVLTVNKSGLGSGNVSSAPTGIDCGLTCSANFDFNTSVTLTATVDIGSTFTGWSGACTGTNACVVTMDAAKFVTANFAQNQYTLTIVSLNGTVTRNPSKATYTYGETVELTAVPNTGYTFANWSGGATGTTNPVTVTINGNTSVTANYTQNQYTLTITSVNGTVTKNPSKATYTYGEIVQLTAAPNAGWTFANWAGGATGTTNPVTVTMNGNKSVTANYVVTTYTLTVDKTGTGTGSVTSNPVGINCGSTCSASFAENTSVTLTAAPDASSTFVGWSGEGCSGTSSCVVNINAVRSVTAEFALIPVPTGLTCSVIQPKPATAATADKPQSKVWSYSGSWYAVFPTNATGASSAGTWLWKLQGTTWTEVLKLSSRTDTKADVKVAGTLAHILLYADTNTQYTTVENVSGNYQLWATRPTLVNITLPGSETATIDQDSTGKLWLATRTSTGEVVVYHSDSPYSTWNGPITLATGVMGNDDLEVVIAMPGNKIGVFWSNQNTRRFGFRIHTDGANPSTWGADESPSSQSAIDNIGTGMADDHMNLAVASDGTLYAAVKTGYDAAGYPKMALLIRRPNGTWDNLYGIDEAGTRPIILLDEVHDVLTYVYTSSENYNPIVYRQSSTQNINFSSRTTLRSASFNDVSSMKENYNNEFVVIYASATEVGGQLCTATPMSGADLSITKSDSKTTTRPNESNIYTLAVTNNGPQAVTGATVADVLPSALVNATWTCSAAGGASCAASGSGNINDTVNLPVGGTVTYTLTTKVDLGARGNATNTATVTPPIGTSDPISSNNSATDTDAILVGGTVCESDPTLVGCWQMEENGGPALMDGSSFISDAGLFNAPAWVTGKVGSYALDLNGTSQYALVPDDASLDLTNNITISVWIKPEQYATQDIVKKATNGGVNGYELSLATTKADASSRKVFFRINQGTSGDTYRINSTTEYPIDGSWMHVAATFDGTTMKLYINGVLESSLIVPPGTLIATNTLPLGIGAQSDGTRWFMGWLDEARVYNRVLSLDNIRELAGVAPLSVSKTGTGSGTVTSVPAGIDCGSTCIFNFAHDSLVTLTASPALGSTFTGWSGACTGTGSCVVTMDTAKSITANFDLTEYTLTITSANGTVAKSPDQATYHYGDSVQLTAVPNAGWTFANWTGGATGTTNPVSITINGNTSVTANYTQQNNAPIITEGETINIIMSVNGSPTPFSLTLNATDPENSTLTWSILTPASHGTASASGTGTSKSISYSPATNYTGSDSFVVQVSDGLATDTITVNVTINDNTAPTVSSITLVDANPTSLASVNFTVTFSEAVSGVDADGSDFTLFTSGISGASITGVTPVSASAYTITVNTGSGNGTIRLDVPNTATIKDVFNNDLSGLPFTNGESYAIEKIIAPPNHTVTFDANGGSGTMSPQIANVPTALTLNTFTRTDYSFSGWNTAANGSGTAYTDGATYPFDADVTLYAQWVDAPPPHVNSITRASTNPSSAASVDFTVTFSEDVTGISTSDPLEDFELYTTGVSGAAITTVSGSGSVYTVTVNTGAGNGTIRLDVPNTATIVDSSNNALVDLPYVEGEEYAILKTTSATFKSSAANDGWILESSETSNSGGSLNSNQKYFTLGDDATNRQYRAILHFDTSALPDNAVVTNMSLKIKQQGNVNGTSPFSFGSLYVDMRNPAFGGSALELADFNFAAKKVKPAVFNPNPVSGWFSARFNTGGKLYVNRTGTTQLRLYFSVDDNNNNIADFIRFYSGNAAAGDRPKLLITYYVP